MRLLSDAAFCEEFDIVVDEISIRYVAGGFEGDEKDRVESYFLRAPDRQNKVRIMCELLHHSAAARAGEREEKPTAADEKPATPAVETDFGWFARLRRFWRNQPLMFRFATTMAVLVIVAGLVFWARPGRPTPTNFATLTLTSSDAERGQQGVEEIKSVKLAPGVEELRVQLLLAPQQTQPKDYRAEIIPTAASRRATVVSQDAQSVVVSIPAVDLKPDRFAIHLFAIYPDGREERIPGSYLFRVE